MKYLSIFSLLAVLLFSCNPYEDSDVILPDPPAKPDFSIEVLQSDPNRVVVTDLSSGNFSRLWDFPGGVPATSKKQIDTVFFQNMGDYAITLHVSAENGGGTAQNTKSVNIAADAAPDCDPQIALLTGDCETPGKCWTFIHEAGAIKVGPTPGSSEWFTSQANGLQAEQYDDSFCFYFDGAHFEYDNNGQTIDPWNGYVPVAYTPPSDYTWLISEGTGANGEDQIILPNGAFLGVWDSGPVYDIVEVTETTLIVRSLISGGAGWFELTFEKR
jgi:hypothetical protein